MTRTPTYYDFLEVSSSASAEQIRSAYLRLMKRHHPDVAGERADAADFLRLINQAYAALGDPVKRAAYDAELTRKERPGPVAAWAQPLPGGNIAIRWWGLWGVLVVALCVGVFLLIPAADGQPESRQAFAPALSWLQPQAMASDNRRTLRLPPPADIRRVANRGATVAPREAAAQSARCFNAARGQASLAAAQLCVIFDDAFLYSHKVPSAGLPPYFSDVMVKLRHSSALGVAPEDPILKRLWQTSFAALMTNLRPAPAAPDTAGAQSARAGFPARSDHLPQAGTAANR